MRNLSPFALLKKHGVSTKNWGKNNFSKTLNHLRKEVRAKECRLIYKKGRINRYSRTVKCSIFHKINGEMHILVEQKQVFTNGTIRDRSLPGKLCLPAEKLFLREDPKTALRRLFEEELQIKDSSIIRNSSLIGQEDEIEESRTYPGLISNRTMYHYEVMLPGNYYKESYVEKQGNYKTYFRWQKCYPNG